MGMSEHEMDELDLSISNKDSSDSPDSDYNVGGKQGFQSNTDDFLKVFTSVARENPERLGLSTTGSAANFASMKRKNPVSAQLLGQSQNIDETQDNKEYTFDIEKRDTRLRNADLGDGA